MNLRAHPTPLLLCLVANVFACEIQTQLDPGTDSAAGGSSGDTPPTDGTADSGVEDSTADSSGDPPASFCVDGDATTPVAILSTASTATLLRADTSEIALDVPPLDPALPEPKSSFAGRGGLIAMGRTSTSLEVDVLPHNSTVALLTVTGERLWSRDEPGYGVGSLMLGADGFVVVSHYDDGYEERGVMYSDSGAFVALAGFNPSGPPRDDGLIPGTRVDTEPGTTGWLSAETLEFRPRTNDARVIQQIDGEYVSFEDRGGVLTLVRESPTEFIEIPLPGVPLHYPDWSSSSPDGSWLLLNDPAIPAWVRVEVATGAVRTLDLTPPDGLAPFGCTLPDATLDDSGRVVLAARDAAAVSALRHDPETGEWERLGEAVTDVEAMKLRVYGGTYVVQSYAPSPSSSCPPSTFEPGDATLEGTTSQIVRPSDGVSRVADDRSVSTSPDGRCVALLGFGIGATTTMIDLREGTEIELPGDIKVTWWDG